MTSPFPYISPQMRGWLTKNRKGRLAFGQWLRLTLQPLLVMILLLLPLLLIIGPRPPRLRQMAYSCAITRTPHPDCHSGLAIRPITHPVRYSLY